ncbi:hypothetical protein MMC30_002777 [Trapelia coarctata]|nr:hypothetical protein [Trapelia coarctata]
MATLSNSTTVREDHYRKFVAETASKITKFTPLNAFLLSTPQRTPAIEACISVITFSEQALPSEPRVIKESDLKKELELQTDYQLFVIANITPDVVALLGGSWGVDPQFFIDYLDTVIPTRPDSKHLQSRYSTTSPLPWYRLDDIEAHLPTLRSVQSKMNHISFRFIGSRQYQPEDSNAPLMDLPDRIEPDLSVSSVERIAGGYNPIPRDGKRFHPVAMTRQCASAWFDGKGSQPRWRKGIILLDPPFEAKENFGQRYSSKYKSFISRPMPPGAGEKDICVRNTYHSSLVHCLKWNPILQVSAIPEPLAILQDLCRIIASEWIAVNTYIERDLNTIEWRLETDKRATLEVFESFLKKLFIMRRRINKYESLVSEQLQSCVSHSPISWLLSSPSPGTSPNSIASTTPQASAALSSDQVSYAMENDLKQVQQLIHRNSDRIMQSIALITSLMSVRGGKTSITQNKTLGFLTALATLALPFNTIAAIVAIQTDYGPTGNNFGMFWAWAGGAWVALLILFFIFRFITSRSVSI